jgi:V/A-type H+-transporting ATPase subunit C
MHRSLLLKLVNLASFEKVIQALPSPMSTWLEGANSAVEVEYRLEAQTAQMLAALLRHSPSAPARALAYLLLREQDLKKLFAIIQAKTLGLDDSLLNEVIGVDGSPSSFAEAASA